MSRVFTISSLNTDQLLKPAQTIIWLYVKGLTISSFKYRSTGKTRTDDYMVDRTNLISLIGLLPYSLPKLVGGRKIFYPESFLKLVRDRVFKGLLLIKGDSASKDDSAK